MRGNIIEELYYGNIDPQDRGYCPKSPVRKASDSLSIAALGNRWSGN